MDIIREGYRFPMSIPEIIDRRIDASHNSNSRHDMEDSWLGRSMNSFDAVFYNDDRDIKIVSANDYLECAKMAGIGHGESNFTYDYFDSEAIPRDDVIKYLDRPIGFSEVRYNCPVWTHFLRYKPSSFEGRADDYLRLLSRFNDNQDAGSYDIDWLKITFPQKYLAKEKKDDFLGFFSLEPLNDGGGLKVSDLGSKGDFAFRFCQIDASEISPSIDDVMDIIRKHVKGKDLDAIRSGLEDKFTYAGIKYNPVIFKPKPSIDEGSIDIDEYLMD